MTAYSSAACEASEMASNPADVLRSVGGTETQALSDTPEFSTAFILVELSAMTAARYMNIVERGADPACALHRRPCAYRTADLCRGNPSTLITGAFAPRID